MLLYVSLTTLCCLLQTVQTKIFNNNKPTDEVRIVWDKTREKDTATPVYSVKGQYYIEVEQLIEDKGSDRFLLLKRVIKLNPNGKWKRRLIQSKNDDYRQRQRREKCAMEGQAKMTREGNMAAFIYTGEHNLHKSDSYQVRNGSMAAIVYSQSETPCQGVSLYWIIPAVAPHKGARKKRFVLEDGTRVEYYEQITLRALPSIGQTMNTNYQRP